MAAPVFSYCSCNQPAGSAQFLGLLSLPIHVSRPMSSGREVIFSAIIAVFISAASLLKATFACTAHSPSIDPALCRCLWLWSTNRTLFCQCCMSIRHVGKQSGISSPGELKSSCFRYCPENTRGSSPKLIRCCANIKDVGTKMTLYWANVGPSVAGSSNTCQSNQCFFVHR